MSLLRTSRVVRPLGIRLVASPSQRRLASQDYGSGDGNPAGENPQQQGRNPSEGLEHPGPPPPSTGKSQQQPAKEHGGSKGTQGAQPKILSSSPPHDSDAPEDVQQHNKEMSQRADKATEKVQDGDVEKDKVSKGFWSGHGGANKSP